MFIARSGKKKQSIFIKCSHDGMYYPLTPKAIYTVIVLTFHCPINAEIRAAEGQSDQSCSVNLCLVCLKEYCYFCMGSSINKCFVSIIILFFLKEKSP